MTPGWPPVACVDRDTKLVVTLVDTVVLVPAGRGEVVDMAVVNDDIFDIKEST